MTRLTATNNSYSTFISYHSLLIFNYVRFELGWTPQYINRT